MLADRNSYAVQAEASARRPLSVRPSGVSQGGLQHRPPPAGLSVMPPEPPVAADRLLTDRSAYMTYLETQVERVTTACLGYEGFDSKITSLTTNQTALEDKVVNLAKLVSSGQQYSEQCTSGVQSTMERVIPRLEALEKREKVFGRHRTGNRIFIPIPSLTNYNHRPSYARNIWLRKIRNPDPKT